MSLTNILVGGKQLLNMGALPYFAGAVLAAFLAGNGTGYKIKSLLDAQKIAHADKLVADIKVQLAEDAASTQKQAREMQEAARADLDQRDAKYANRVDTALNGVVKQFDTRFTALMESINGPQFDCVRTTPLPESFLDGLRRPGSTGGNSPGRSPGENAPSLF